MAGCYSYILKSLKDGRLYVGVAHDIQNRLAQHNGGRVKSTKSRRPFVVLYSREFKSMSEARKFEWMLKNTPGGGKLKKRLAEQGQ